MPREIFGHVTDPPVALGSRKWYTVPLSCAAHVLAIVPVILVPLLATDVLPLPHDYDVFVVAPPAPPEPPAPPRPAERKQPVSDPSIPPVDAPQGITKEPDYQGEPLSDPKGAIGGIVDGVGTVITDPGPAPPPVPVERKPVRPGGNIRPPERIRAPSPVYPPIAQAAGVQGVVILEAIIGVDGKVQNVRVLRSIPLLDQAAINAVRQWEYTATTLNGVPVPIIMSVTVTFTLRRD